MAHRGRGQRPRGRAARRRWREQAHDRIRRRLHGNCHLALPQRVRDVRLFLVVHPDQRGCKAGDLRGFRDDKRDRLAAEHDPVAVERPERRPNRSHLILVSFIVVRHARAVLVRNHVDNALDAQGGASLDPGDAALRDRRRDDAPVRKPGDIELGGVFRGAGDLGDAVDAGGGSADVLCHGDAQTIFLDDCDCGVPRAAWESARTMQRRARSILNMLCS